VEEFRPIFCYFVLFYCSVRSAVTK